LTRGLKKKLLKHING